MHAVQFSALLTWPHSPDYLNVDDDGEEPEDDTDVYSPDNFEEVPLPTPSPTMKTGKKEVAYAFAYAPTVYTSAYSTHNVRYFTV